MKDEPKTALGKFLRASRKEQGLNQNQLATRSGINRSTLLRIEDGSISQPSVQTLNVLARVLNVDPEDFYDAVWQDTGGPLPSAATYFRSKYGLEDRQVAELQAALERLTKSDEQ